MDEAMECPACGEIALTVVEVVQTLDHHENELIVTHYACQECNHYETD